MKSETDLTVKMAKLNLVQIVTTLSNHYIQAVTDIQGKRNFKMIKFQTL